MFLLRLLGDPSLVGPDGPVAGRAAYRRRIALLAVLAAARGRAVGRERLVGLLWAEFPADAARHTLSQALYVLRKELGESVFVVTGDEVGLNAALVRSDVDAFLAAVEEGRLEDAVREYTGPFLDGFFVPDALEFERWAEAERDRLARAYARVLESLAEGCEAEGDTRGAAEWWRRLSAHDPFSSRAALRTARALHDAGEPAAALRHAESHAALLAEELGVGPDAELADFVHRVRTDAAPLPAAPRRAVAALPSLPSEPPGVLDDADAIQPPRSTPTDAAPHGVSPVDLPAVLARTPAPASLRHRTASAPRASQGVYWVLVALALAAFALLPASRREITPPSSPVADPRRIAVLYFEDDSPRGDLGYLAGGLTESLIHELSRVPALSVISRNGVKPYRQGTLPLDSVAARLGVGTVVEGSVQRAGDSVRVTVHLIDPSTQSPVESRQVVRPLDDVLALESALAEEVGGFLRRRLGRQIRVRRVEAGTRNPQARALVLRAAQATDESAQVGASPQPLDVESSLRLSARADSLLARAQAADPNWTLPGVLRGRYALDAAGRAPAQRDRLLAAAVRHADDVLHRDPHNAEALFVRGDARRMAALRPGEGTASLRELDQAEADLRAALAADPSLAHAWGALAQLLLARGHLAEGRLAAERALAADVYLDGGARLLRRLYFVALAQADYPVAAATCARGARMFPGDWNFVQCRLTLLREDATRPPDPALAWRLVETLERMDPAPRARAEGREYAPLYRTLVAAAVSLRAGDTLRARVALRDARLSAAADTAVHLPMLYDEAYLVWQLGDPGAALRLLERYTGSRPALRDFLARDPLFRGLRPSAVTPAGASPRPR